MDEDLLLEESQRLPFDDTLNVYCFDCEGGGAKSEIKSFNFASKKPGINLHFMRLGLFENTAENDIAVSAPNGFSSTERITVNGCPTPKNFHFAITALNPGYIYIIDANNNNLFYEYEVNEYGLLTPVLWESNKKNGKYSDVRMSSFMGSREHVTFKSENAYWIAYSAVQWSISYFNVMLNDAGRRNERMIFLECTGFDPGSTGQNFIKPYDNINGKFKKYHYPQATWHKSTITTLYNEENNPDIPPPEIREDMFIALDDPIGCANDINAALSEKGLRFKALVNSIQTGNSEQEEYDKTLNGDFELKSGNTEHQELFTLALFCYQFVYNTKDNIDQYEGNKFTGKGIDYEKISGILGIEERTSLRNIYQSYRDDFGIFLGCDYFKKVLEDYLHNISTRVVYGRAAIFEMLQNLFTNPYYIDKQLLLKEDFVEEDGWKNWIFDLETV